MAKEIILGDKSKITIPFEAQKEHIQYHNSIDSHELPEAILFNESKKLFLENADLGEKKKLLYLLAHNGTPKAYKFLEKYNKKSDKQLKFWAELCLQECAGHLSIELLGQEETL